jgi:hypothetical protein
MDITQEQLGAAMAAYDRGVSPDQVGQVWNELRKSETEARLTAARDSYEKKQYQRAADHYAALDSELGEGAPLPGIWGRNDPYEGLAKSSGSRPHAWDDIIADLGAMQAHLGRVHHVDHEGRSMAGLRAVHNGLHGVDDCGRRLGVSAPGPHAYTEFKDDPLGDAVRWHLENVHEVSGHGLSPAQLKQVHRHAHDTMKTRPAAEPALVPGPMSEANVWRAVDVKDPDSDFIVRGTITGSFGPDAEDHHHASVLSGLRRHLADAHHAAVPGHAGITTMREMHKKGHSQLKELRGLENETMDVRSAMSMLAELSRLQPSDVQRALGYLSGGELDGLAAVITQIPEKATEHEH